MISVVLPSYNEAASIQQTLRRAAAALESTGEPYELLVVDDSSPDGTADLAEALSAELPVRVLRRPGRSGLARAVVEGWKAARGDVLGVMDADLQHPPEVLAKLAAALNDPTVDIVIASRSGPGGGTADWSVTRQVTSWGAMHIASCVLPWTLADVHDPMSGMFMVRAEALRGAALEPTGYKILLEVLAKAHYKRVAEVPYIFGPRDKGSSKLGLRQTAQYLMHLARLALFTGQFRTWLRYASVGFSGAAIHLGVLAYLVESKAWPLSESLLIAIQAALLSNFIGNNVFTFRAMASREGMGTDLVTRFANYETVCATGAALNFIATILLFHWRCPFLPAAAVGVVAGGVWNLFFNVPSIWRASTSRRWSREVALSSEAKQVRVL